MHQAVSRALAHVKAAQTALEEAVPSEEPESLQHDELVSAYRALQREHEELRAQYEADKQTWREFKRWWKQKPGASAPSAVPNERAARPIQGHGAVCPETHGKRASSARDGA